MQYRQLSSLVLTSINFLVDDLRLLLGDSPLANLTLINSKIEGQDFAQLNSLLDTKYHLSSPKEEYRFLDSKTGIDWPAGPGFDEVLKEQDPTRFIVRKVLWWAEEAGA
jgi:hypothetical protein